VLVVGEKRIRHAQELSKPGYIASEKSNILELPLEPRNVIVAQVSVLFDKLEWTTVKGSDIGLVGVSKILFATLPEIAPTVGRIWVTCSSEKASQIKTLCIA
jgi:hypothetical protein